MLYQVHLAMNGIQSHNKINHSPNYHQTAKLKHKKKIIEFDDSLSLYSYILVTCKVSIHFSVFDEEIIRM